jgi:hypothetical protein
VAGPGERVFVRLHPVDPVEGVWIERVGSSGRRSLMANL